MVYLYFKCLGKNSKLFVLSHTFGFSADLSYSGLSSCPVDQGEPSLQLLGVWVYSSLLVAPYSGVQEVSLVLRKTVN
jgi:hypothetical protein